MNISTTIPCITKSVTLAAGEQFILPPNSEVIFTTDSTVITATNDCVTFPPTPPIVCYTFDTLIGNPGGDVSGDSCDQHWESFTYAGITVGFNTGSTGICGPYGNVVGTSGEVWSALKGNAAIGPLIVGVAAAMEPWSGGDQYGVKVRMYDLGIGPPTMVIRDGNNANPYDGANSAVTAVGRIIDCNQCAMGGRHQNYDGHGDPGTIGPC